MLEKLIQIKRDCDDVKQQIIGQTVEVFEKKTNPFFFVAFFSLTVFSWLLAKFSVVGFEKMFEISGVYPLAAFLVISYYTLFLGSKLLFKPTSEELLDDTSKFAIFSACSRRARRSFISLGLSVLHTLFLTIILIDKDLRFL